MHEQIGEHILWHLPALGPVHADTIMTTWLVMVVCVDFFRLDRRQLSFALRFQAPSGPRIRLQLHRGSRHQRARRRRRTVRAVLRCAIHLHFFAQPVRHAAFKALGLPFGGSPTADLNTVVPLALVVFVMIQVVAFRRKGLSYSGHVLKPFPALLPVNILDEILRPITLAARLFFNIFVGELLFVIVTSIIWRASASGFSTYRWALRSFRS